MSPFILALLSAAPAANVPGETIAGAPDPVEEIVVEGRRQNESPYRIPPEPPRRLLLPKAELRISERVTAALSIAGGDVGGIPTNRAMISIKIRF